MDNKCLGLKVTTTSGQVLVYGVSQDYEEECPGCFDDDLECTAWCLNGDLRHYYAHGGVLLIDRHERSFLLVRGQIVSIEVVTLTVRPKRKNPLETEAHYDDPLS